MGEGERKLKRIQNRHPSLPQEGKETTIRKNKRDRLAKQKNV